MKLFADFFEEFHATNNEIVEKLSDEVSTLRDRVQKLEDKLDDAAQYSRLDHVVISPKDNGGVPIYNRDENSKSIVRNLFREHLSLELAENDISIAHRIGKVKMDPRTNRPMEDRRSIIVRLCRKELIGTIFAHCKNTTAPFYVNESLTPTRGKICFILRKLKKNSDKITKVRTFKGIPRAFHKSPRRNTRNSTNDVYTEISTMLQLEKFVTDHLGTTLLELSRHPENGFSI